MAKTAVAGSGSFPWSQFASYATACKVAGRVEKNCVSEIIRLLENEVIWGDSGANYHRGKTFWPDQKLEISFTNKNDEEGDFAIVSKKGKLIPRITLSPKADPFELLITINHELVHFGNSENIKKLYAVSKKKADCVNDYELALLNNEKQAYLSEVYFWRSAPEWFRNEMKRFHFNSRLLGEAKVTYADFYAKLGKSMADESKFITRRYVELGKFPKCALESAAN